MFFATVRDLMLAGFSLLGMCLPISAQDAVIMGVPFTPVEMARFEAVGQSERTDQRTWTEVQWSKHLAESIHAEAEYRLQDGSRIDIFQPGVCAWEVEWVDKWEEAFGQAAFYAASTDTTPGIWLLKRGKEDDEDYLRFLTTLHFYRCQGVQIKWNVTEVKP